MQCFFFSTVQDAFFRKSPEKKKHITLNYYILLSQPFLPQYEKKETFLLLNVVCAN